MSARYDNKGRAALSLVFYFWEHMSIIFVYISHRRYLFTKSYNHQSEVTNLF
jgi:hypothetical protein